MLLLLLKKNKLEKGKATFQIILKFILPQPLTGSFLAEEL